MKRKLDREIRFDEKSKNYPISSILTTKMLNNKIWKCEKFLDQGTEGACVGFAWGHGLNAAPYNTPVTNNTARTIYYAAQQWDEWAGTEYDGTSVIAGAKTISSLGFMSEYRWAFGIDDVINTLSNYSPVILGVNWYSDMLDTDENGFIQPTGELLGGHALLANGIEVSNDILHETTPIEELTRKNWKVWRRTSKNRMNFREWKKNKVSSVVYGEMLPDPIIRLHNSWGKGWGVNGDAFIYASDLAKLLNEDGEACVPVKRN